jgi:hypothetical protein
MYVHDSDPAPVVIAERSPRWLAMITTVLLAFLPGLELVKNSPTLLPRGHVPAAVAYLAAAASVSIWGCWRGWRMGLRLDGDGVTVRNFFHSYQFGWPEVSRFADGSVNGGNNGRLWALSVVLNDGRVIPASGTSRGKRDARPQTLTEITPPRHRGIPRRAGDPAAGGPVLRQPGRPGSTGHRVVCRSPGRPLAAGFAVVRRRLDALDVPGPRLLVPDRR